jgi:tRNA(Ile)-lysidine synthase
VTGPDPAVAAVRLAVRRGLPVLRAEGDRVWVPESKGTVLVACSGGADSLALLAATVFELRRSDLRVIGTVVDHGLQEGSAEHTARVVQQMADLGADETASIRVTVDPGPRGVEAGAREARYAALSQLALHFGATHVLLGHTVDDQAESVLLGLTQGSGPRSLAGMRDSFRQERGDTHLFVRPLLRSVTRAQTEAACQAEGIGSWEDPHNVDQRFLRARVRHVVLPLLEAELGPGVAGALARTGHLLREDLDALDGEAELLAEAHRDGLDVWEVETLSRAVRTRVLRLLALRAGVPPRDLTHGHLEALEDMVWRRRGEDRDVDLPGHVRAVRREDLIRFVDTRPRPDGPVAG